jgi:predicted dienelactone hydrolase
VTDVWYPAEAGTTGDASVYQFIPGIEFASQTALADVAVSTDGPFPLVVYSHGSGGLRYVASFFTELLASHGFVVAAVDHVGNTAIELVAGGEFDRDQIAYDRVLDVDQVITQLLDASAAEGGQLSGTIDPERIGITGHSFGGFTAFASVGGYRNDLGSIPGDDRIDAVAAMAPASELNSTEELEAVDVPTLLVSGTRDETTPIDPDTEKAWQYVSGRPLWRVDITDAGHQSFTDVCDYQELLPTLNAPQLLIDAVAEYAAEGCTEELVPIDTAHELINRNTVAFLLAYVAGEEGYEAFLAQEVPGEVVQVKE